MKNILIRNFWLTVVDVLLIGASAGCVVPERTPPPPTAQTVEYRVPVITPVEPDKQLQEKDGIRISVAPYSYNTVRTVRKEYRELPALLIVNNQYPAEVREMTSLSVHPREVRFKVKIYNQLERVLRLAGTVVSFQVAGKTLALDAKAHYDDFLNGIILPRQEGEYEIAGPDWAALADNATIALFLYDIVTATDAAGNPSKRSNFEWFYTLSLERKTQELPITVRKVYLSESAALVLHPRQQAALGQWVSAPELDSMPIR